jgi:hypothetical protein
MIGLCDFVFLGRKKHIISRRGAEAQRNAEKDMGVMIFDTIMVLHYHRLTALEAWLFAQVRRRSYKFANHPESQWS